MTGVVDDFGRALLRLLIRHPAGMPETELDVWIDTGFTGELVLPQQHVAALGLPLGLGIDATLADGSKVQLDAYICLLDWFGEWKRVEVIANQGRFPLLGVGLLLDRKLHIDYGAKTLSIE